jgi:resuscitation-promoting factor RpfA
MSKHRRYRGRHRAPSTAGQTAAKVAVAGAAAGVSLGLAPAAHAAPDAVWDELAECESSGNWAINTGNGYFGGVQFHPQTWTGFGGREFASSAHQASREEQIVVAERVLDVQGWNAWPACSRKLGLRGHGVDLREAPSQPSAPQSSPDRGAPSPAASGDTYTVVTGDTLSKIAQAHGTTWQAVFDANRDVVENADVIFPGERLVLP